MPNQLVVYFLGALAVSAAGWLGYSAIHDRGVESCRADVELDRLHAEEAAHQIYLAEVERGNALSAELVKTQRRLDATKTEYLAYAHAITGVCDPSVRLLVEYASGAKNPLPEATGAPVDGSFADEAIERAYQEAVARIVGVNIAENYSRLDFCIAEKRAINAWHAGPEGAVK